MKPSRCLHKAFAKVAIFCHLVSLISFLKMLAFSFVNLPILEPRPTATHKPPILCACNRVKALCGCNEVKAVCARIVWMQWCQNLCGCNEVKTVCGCNEVTAMGAHHEVTTASANCEFPTMSAHYEFTTQHTMQYTSIQQNTTQCKNTPLHPQPPNPQTPISF